ncbi:MAG: hypothetical protein AAF570_02455, partial [Bacteroidota bacterium]
KLVMESKVDEKDARPTKAPRYFMTIGGKEYQVSKEVWERFAPGDPVSVFFTPFSRLWLGLERPAPQNAE